MKTLKLVLAMVLPATVCLAAGFALDEQSARTLGMGGVGAAAAEGAVTVYYSPGAMAFEDGIAAEISGVLIIPSTSYTAPGGGTAMHAEGSTFFLPTLFATAHLLDNVTFGLGGFSNFGLGITWPNNFPGRFDTLSSSITTYTINPAISVAIGEHFGIGLGVDIVRATLQLQQDLNFGDAGPGSVLLGGGTWGVGFNAGLAARFLDDSLRLGLTWRSFVPLDIAGLAHFAVPVEFQSSSPDEGVHTSLTLPNLFALGGSYRVTQALKLALDLDYTTWSSLGSLDLDFNTLTPQHLKKNWRNTLSVRVGAEYAIGRCWNVRLGVGYDPSPSPSYTLSSSLPDADRELIGAGLGFHGGMFFADLGYQFVYSNTRTTTPPAFPATYHTIANLAALTLGFRM